MIRRHLSDVCVRAFGQYPVLTVTGPRQSGKTTLARMTFDTLPYLNLEHLNTLQRAQLDPVGFIDALPNGAIIDEIQRAPELLSQIQVSVDERRRNGMFVLTGSSQMSLMEGVSQSLAGRTLLLKLLPFSLSELRESGLNTDLDADNLMYSGFYPRIFDQHLNPTELLGAYIETYVERDLRGFAQIRDLSLFRRFLSLCAGRVGQLFNASSLANDVGVSKTTITTWASILEASYILYFVQPFHANIRKRLVKSPKLYFYDTGLVSYLLGIESAAQIATHPLRGNLFENFVISEVLKHGFNQARSANIAFFRDSNGNEVDLMVQRADQWIPIEIKSAKTFRQEQLNGLQYIMKLLPGKIISPMLLHAGEETWQLDDITVANISHLSEHLSGLY